MILYSKLFITVKNMFGLQDVYLQGFMTRLTLVVRTRPFLKLTFSDKSRLAAFHSCIDKESVFALEKCHWGVVTLIHFFVVTN
jgi:hypothetical protein